MAFGSAILDGNSIYSFAGKNGDSQYPVERLDMATDGTIEGSELIGTQDGFFRYPVLFITDANTCVTN